MKRNLIVYASALIGAIILGKTRPGFVSTMIFYIMVCIPVADLILMALTYKFFMLTHSVDQRTVVKGAMVQYEISLVNPSLFVFSPIKVFYTGDDLLFEESDLREKNTLILYPFSRETFVKHILCKYRGAYTVGVEKIKILGYFGLFSFDYRGVETHKILVYPTVHDLKPVNFKYAMSDSNESIVSFDKFDQSLFSEIRTYRPGDSLNKIHWKLSARQGEFMTKEFEGNVTNRTKVLVNNESLALGYQRQIVLEDYIVEGVVALSKYLLEQNIPIEMHWHHYDQMREFGNGPKDFMKFYEALARMNFEYDEGMFVKLIEAESQSGYEKCVLMIVTSKLTYAMSDVLLRKKRQGFEVTIVTTNPRGFAMAKEELKFDAGPLYKLMDAGVRVYHMEFEDGVCRLEVA